MPPKQQVNIRVAQITLQQMQALRAATGLTQTQIIAMAIDRLAREIEAQRKEDASKEKSE